MSVDEIQSVLSVFGRIAAARDLPLPDNSVGLVARVFEFCNVLHARMAVQAIGNRPGIAFSLHLADSRGVVVSDDLTVRTRISSDSPSSTEATAQHDGARSTGGPAPDAMLRAPAAPLPTALPQAQPQSLHPYAAPPPPWSGRPDVRSSTASTATMGSAGMRSMQAQPLSHSAQMMSYGDSSGPSCVSTDTQMAGTTSAAMPMPRAAPPSACTIPPGAPFFTASLPAAGTSVGNAQLQHMLHAASEPTPALKGKRRTDLLTAFDVNEAAANGPRSRTTVMVRNIPCRWTAEDFLTCLKPVIGGMWDLLYMPCKMAEIANSGYAFLNFKSAHGTLRLYNAMHGRNWPNTRSGKVCEIRYARIQGRQLLSHLGSGDPASAAAFRGYLAYPSGDQIVVHGPDATAPQGGPPGEAFAPPPADAWPLAALQRGASAFADGPTPFWPGAPPAVPPAGMLQQGAPSPMMLSDTFDSSMGRMPHAAPYLPHLPPPMPLGSAPSAPPFQAAYSAQRGQQGGDHAPLDAHMRAGGGNVGFSSGGVPVWNKGPGPPQGRVNSDAMQVRHDSTLVIA